MLVRQFNDYVVFGCVTDQQQKFFDQAVRLVASLRWFGGELANAPFIICAVDGMPDEYRQQLIKLGAVVRDVERFDARHGPSNKMRFLELPEVNQYQHVCLLDCDTLVVQDLSRFLPDEGLAIKPADLVSVTVEQFQQIFSYFGLVAPEPSYFTDVSNEPILSYFNSGVCLFSQGTLPIIRGAWARWNKKLLDAGEALPHKKFFTDQASLTMAIVETGIVIKPLPSIMNFPVHLPEKLYSAEYFFKDPVIIHYHGMAHEGGGIMDLPLVGAAHRAELFNQRFTQENLLPVRAA